MPTDTGKTETDGHPGVPRWTLTIRGGLLLLTLLAVLPSLALQVYDGVARRHHLVEDATQEALRSASSMAQVQVRIADSSRLLLSALALMPQVRHLDIVACTSLFTSLLKQNPMYLNILAIDKDGSIVASGLPFTRTNLSDRKHVHEALATSTFSAGEYIVSRMAFEPTFPFAFPFHDDAGAIAGELLASVKLSVYDAMFDQLNLPAGSVLSIMDHRGTRLHFRPKSASNPPGQPVRREIWQIISQGGDTGLMPVRGADGHSRYYAWSKVRLSPQQPPYMIFVVGLPESAVLLPARRALIQNLLLLVGVAGLAVWVAWFVGGAIIARRLDRIAETADRIGQGDLTARTDVPYGDSGIGKVAKTLDATAKLLTAHDNARERALAALRQSQERMAQITATMADWIWEIDEEDRFSHASEQVQKTLGYEPEELCGKTPYDFMEPEEANRTRAVFDAVKARRQPLKDLEYWFVAKDGKKHCQRANGVPRHDETGAYRGYRGVSKDVTEAVQAQQAILESLRDKEVLLKEIHHRVKNNLQIISGLLYLQEEQVEDPKALEAFRVSRNRIASMALVHEKLYRSPNLSRVCLGEYVRDLLPRLFGEADAEHPRIVHNLHLEDVRVPIEQAVPSGLIINELLTNAYKHGFAGRDAGVLTITVKEDGDMITVEIRDDGPGLPEGLDITRTSSLGMQLVCNLARQLRGDITAQNDGGAVFTLRFPKQPA